MTRRLHDNGDGLRYVQIAAWYEMVRNDREDILAHLKDKCRKCRKYRKLEPQKNELYRYAWHINAAYAAIGTTEERIEWVRKTC
jgi:hypothetical protein